MKETTLDEAIEKAPIVCAARIVGHEFDGLKPGETRRTSQRFWLEIRYQVTEVFRDRSDKLACGNVLAIRQKSNSCLVFEEDVSYESRSLLFVRRDRLPDGKEETAQERLTVPVGKKVILFLGEDRTHYGWFVSPQDDTAALRSKLKPPAQR
ncbi:MAG: hypothetical protein HY815_16890 [Candidatus Riflebacteria bacterium]|nr:hypothetical protein [Candidatus Riflebacteria bacterium]